jgi:hypothetical protein
MSELPHPSKITPQEIEAQKPIDEHTPKEPTREFLSMKMTNEEYQKFLSTQIKMMLSDIKKGEKKMIEAMRKISDSEE